MSLDDVEFQKEWLRFKSEFELRTSDRIEIQDRSPSPRNSDHGRILLLDSIPARGQKCCARTLFANTQFQPNP
jgi:hypothetical protein